MNFKNYYTGGLTLIFFLQFTLNANGQGIDLPLQQSVEQEKWDVLSTPEEVDLAVYHDYEQDLRENPVNLGEINPLELLRLGILNRNEMDALYQYLLDYGPMVTIYELQMVEGIPAEKIKELIGYICVNQAAKLIPSLGDLFSYPKVEMLLSGKRCLENKAGYVQDTTNISLANQYQGSPWQQKLSFKVSFGRNLVMGFSGKNDAGEQNLTSLKSYSFDDRSFFLGINNIASVKKLIIGRYGVSFGQGLTLGCGSSMSLGKENDLRMQSRGLYPGLSSNNTSSLQGAALWLKPASFNLCLFYSAQKLDATIATSDSMTDQPYYTTITEGGYHRTSTEISKKDQIMEKDAGMYLSIGGEQWKSGLSFLYHKLDIRPAAAQPVYKYFATQSGDSWAGWDGIVFLRKFTAFHELCLSSNGKLAGLGGMTFSPAPLVKTSLLLDVIPGFWNNPHCSKSLAGSTGANQLDISSSIQFILSPKVEVQLSAEDTRYRWLRYTVTSPSDKISYHILLTYHPSKISQLEVYFKMVDDEKNVNSEGKTDSIAEIIRNTVGVLCKFFPDDKLSIKLSVRTVQNRLALKTPATGWLMSQDVSFWPIRKKLKLNAHLAFFETDTYNERIYSWEADVYRGFSVPAYYGRGYQYALVVQYHLNRWVDAWMKYSVYHYPDQSCIGSGSEQINGNKKSELTIELRMVLPGNRP